MIRNPIKHQICLILTVLLFTLPLFACNKIRFPATTKSFYKNSMVVGCGKEEFVIDDDYILMAVDDYAKTSKEGLEGRMVCEFYDLVNEHSALLVFNALKINSDSAAKDYSSTNSQGSKGYSRYNVSDGKTTFIIILVKNTVLYIKADNCFIDDAEKLISLLEYQ